MKTCTYAPRNAGTTRGFLTGAEMVLPMVAANANHEANLASPAVLRLMSSKRAPASTGPSSRQPIITTPPPSRNPHRARSAPPQHIVPRVPSPQASGRRPSCARLGPCGRHPEPSEFADIFGCVVEALGHDPNMVRTTSASGHERLRLTGRVERSKFRGSSLGLETDRRRGDVMGHVWTAPGCQGFGALQRWSVQPCVRPLNAAHMTLAIMPSADQVPVKSAHSTVRWPKWVVLITGSTRSALRAVSPLQPFRHARYGAISQFFIAKPHFARAAGSR